MARRLTGAGHDYRLGYYGLSSAREPTADMTSRSTRKARRPWIAAWFSALTLLLGACGSSGGALGFVASGPPLPLPPPGALTPVSGSEFEGILAGLRGTPVVVNVWASWCGPCRVEAPLLQKASERYGERVVFLGVDARDSEDEARDFLRRYAITYPNVVDADEEITGRLGLRGFPTTYIFDRAGKVRASVIGGISEQVLGARIDEALRS